MTPDEIKEKRISLGYTQEKFAELLQVETQTIRLWEKGKRKPRYKMIFDLINKL